MDSTAIACIVGLIALLLGVAIGTRIEHPFLRPRRVTGAGDSVRKILLPFAEPTISRRALEAALRIAKAENAAILPAFLATIPRNLTLDAPAIKQSEYGMPVIEAIEQIAHARGIHVDSRVVRGRSARDALRRLLEQEKVDRIIVSLTTDDNAGLDADDMQWLIAKAPAEVLILRPAFNDDRRISGKTISGHF